MTGVKGNNIRILKTFLAVFPFVIAYSVATPALTVQDFLKEVALRNLDLKVQNSKKKAAEANAIGLKLPDPMVGLSHMKEDGGGSAFGFEVSQNIPFPTKVFSDRSARKNLSQAQDAAYVQRRNEILSEARLKYIELWVAQQRVKFLEEKKDVLKSHLKISRSQTRADSSSSVHLLKSESDADLLENEIEVAKQDVLEMSAQLAEWIDADFEDFKPHLEEPAETRIPEVSKADAPALKEKEFLGASAGARLSEARSAWVPDLSFKYREIGATQMSPRTRDIMVGVSVPFAFFWQPYAANKKSFAEKEMAEAELQKQRRSTKANRSLLHSRIESFQRQLAKLKNSLIPRAEKRAHISHGITLRDMESLQDHRETLETLPDLKLKALELRLSYERAIAEYQKHFGYDGSDQ